MDPIPPYDFHKYVFAARCAVLSCSSVEILLMLFGALSDSSILAKLFYLLFLAVSTAVSAHNIALNVDGRAEIGKVLVSGDSEVRAKSTVLVIAPVFSGIFVFLCVSGHASFSFFVLIHVLAAVGQLGLEAHEVNNLIPAVPSVSSDTPMPQSLPQTPQPDPRASPIQPPADRNARAATHDPNYQTLNNIHNDVFAKK
ncbi:unnamed protein product [Caenorhabditis sp. 36 PRJEB53466]|nr:unnamed protein product [Caenorhabditis sp. 36 PRJEB53466]